MTHPTHKEGKPLYQMGMGGAHHLMGGDCRIIPPSAYTYCIYTACFAGTLNWHKKTPSTSGTVYIIQHL